MPGNPTTARSWSRSSARCTTASCSSTSRPTWYLISRLQTSFLREQLSVEATGVWGINEAALHLAPRVSYAITDTWSAAAGANLWFTLDGPDSTKVGLLRRDDAKDNVFIQTTLRY